MRDPAGSGSMLHPTADVDETAAIGEGCQVWHHTQIRERAVLGIDCVIGKDVYIDHDVHVGDRVKIQNGALIYHGVTLESGVFVGPGAIFTNDVYPRSINAAGELASASEWQVTATTVGYGSSIGAGAIVVAGSHIGRYAMVGAGAVVTRPVADHALVVGNPARQIGWVCRCGHRLESAEQPKPAAPGAGTARCPLDDERFDIADGVCRPVAVAA
jgi:UDP-2-acetamido-3-amino-2,3-dideoxy-glucuronate N-acetyltransferase